MEMRDRQRRGGGRREDPRYGHGRYDYQPWNEDLESWEEFEHRGRPTRRDGGPAESGRSVPRDREADRFYDRRGIRDDAPYRRRDDGRYYDHRPRYDEGTLYDNRPQYDDRRRYDDYSPNGDGRGYLGGRQYDDRPRYDDRRRYDDRARYDGHRPNDGRRPHGEGGQRHPSGPTWRAFEEWGGTSYGDEREQGFGWNRGDDYADRYWSYSSRNRNQGDWWRPHREDWSDDWS